MTGTVRALCALLAAALALAACQTTGRAAAPASRRPAAASAVEPALPTLHPVAAYSNRHGISFRYPRAWHVEDATLGFDDLAAAAAEGGAYLQVYSYDRQTAVDPSAPVPATEAKIMISLMRNEGNLDYPEFLEGLGADIVTRAALRVDGAPAWKVHYRITGQENGGKLDILCIFLIEKGWIARFICYPWNSRYEAQFEELAESFHRR
jgi:hypothetical protein